MGWGTRSWQGFLGGDDGGVDGGSSSSETSILVPCGIVNLFFGRVPTIMMKICSIFVGFGISRGFLLLSDLAEILGILGK